MATARLRRQRLTEARAVLQALGLPEAQQNERAALTLLALLDLPADRPWNEAAERSIGVTPIMEFALEHYRVEWAPNTRETVRRFTMHQFVQAGLAVANPDEPGRPTNSPKFCYQVTPEALAVIRTYGSRAWDAKLREFLAAGVTLAARYRQLRELAKIPIEVAAGTTIRLTPGGQNELVRAILEEFAPRFTPGARAIYVGDTGEKWAYFDERHLAELGVTVEEHGKMPDVVLHFEEKSWLVLVEAVTSHGPVSPKRMAELKELFVNSSAGLVFVTAFLDRPGLFRYLAEIAWETEVWIAQDPDHMIHFNGQRFLGPY